MNAIQSFSDYHRIQPVFIAKDKLDYSTVQKFQPDFRMVDPATLFVDDKYQRGVSRASSRLIMKIIREWSWQAFKPPICTEYEDGNLYVLDGQHTSIAAASHPDIALIPIFVVKTLEAKERAEAFIRHNHDRTRVTDIQLFKARLEAGEDTATSINMALQRSGARLVGNVSHFGESKIGDVSCLATLESVLNRRGLMKLREVLDVCIEAKLAPIQAHHVYAIDDLLNDKKHKGNYAKEAIALVIRDYPYSQLVGDIETRSRVEKKTKRVMATTLIARSYESKFGDR